ncbi:reverse transcriptase domain-containing protein [Citrus sinensis]|nr:reverse transcriptase domain-containing protein [Citrus sinensis]
MAGTSTTMEADLNNSYAQFTLAEEEEGGIIVAGAEDDEHEEPKSDFHYCLVEKSCPSLYESTTATITKLYGHWMKVPTRRNLMNAGDRWLRSTPPGEEEMKFGSCINSGEAMTIDMEGTIKSGLNEGNNYEGGDITGIVNTIAGSQHFLTKRGQLLDKGKDVVAPPKVSGQLQECGEEFNSDTGTWRCTGFYGFPKTRKRRDSWELLRSLSSISSLPWVCIGDFNDLLHNSEKRGGCQHPNWKLKGFRDAVSDPGLVDLSMEGYQYTWEEVVTKSWELSGGLSIQSKLSFCGYDLMRWGGHLACDFINRLASYKQKIGSLKGCQDQTSLDEFVETRKRYNELLHNHEVFWKQRSKSLWLKEGDMNSQYFHSTASTSNRQNTIGRLRNSSGQWCSNSAEVNSLIVEYFSKLFHSEGSTSADILSCVATKIAAAQNQDLLEPFTATDVRDALFSMHPDKSPRPDGMNPAFFQKFWHIVGGDFTAACLSFIDKCEFPDELNATAIVLIPKKSQPEYLADLRPITLCNVLYKIVVKMLANRMKAIRSSIISENQSAFVPGRAITDNILISAEIMHYLKRKRQGKTWITTLKIDMSKAYDRIEWGFLKAMMLKLGFAKIWVELILLCVSTVTYKVLQGNKEVGPIVPNRGLRHGDPLSLYLFIICAEGLSSLLRKQERAGLMHGVRVARGVPIVTHLFFADDCFLFFHANEQEAQIIKQSLAIYGAASGQVVNYNKSSISYSTNVRVVSAQQVCDILEVAATSNHGSYLGLPSSIGRNKNEAFHFIRDKLHYFNIAMLGKQGWRLLFHPDSLVARILKARYYPLSSFGKATVGSNPNYAWRSIIAADNVIIQGSRIQIGNGLQTTIGGSPWLLDLDHGYVTTSLPNAIINAPISSLMLPGQRNWDLDALTNIFNERDRALITQIPLSSRSDDDAWYWSADSRVVNVLPTADNLRCRQVELSSVCSICNAAIESVVHCLVNYSFAKSCWPSVGWFKCNVDAATFSSSGKISYGAVIRNSDGAFIAARSDSFIGSFGAREAEAIGVREILSWLKGLPVFPVIVEMDSLQVFNALTIASFSPNGFDLIIDDCRALAQFLGDVTFSFVRRSANSAAHSIARVGGSLSGPREWRHVPPPWLISKLSA